jgi:hypothetical protein
MRLLPFLPSLTDMPDSPRRHRVIFYALNDFAILKQQFRLVMTGQ